MILALAACGAVSAFSQEAREIVRKSVELDQANWLRMADYTWFAHSRERHFDSRNRVASEHEEGWETIILGGEPYRRTLERDNQPLPAEQQRRLAEYDNQRRREREFLLEVPDAFDFRLDGDETVDGQNVWMISGVPKPEYHAKTRDGRALLKIRGKLWIEKAGYQWVRLEAQTTATISFGLFLARLNPGASLVFEQTRVNNEVWLPKREWLRGSGRIGLLKRVAEDQEITWSHYRKFQVDSKIVP